MLRPLAPKRGKLVGMVVLGTLRVALFIGLTAWCGCNSPANEVGLARDGGEMDAQADDATNPYGEGDGQALESSNGTVPPSCPPLETAPLDAGEVGDATPIQAWCDSGLANPSACPGSVPDPGSACSEPGLLCGYHALENGLVMATCDEAGAHWALRSANCGWDCPGAGPHIPIGGAVACAERDVVACAPHPQRSDQEQADRVLRDVAACCVPPSELELEVVFEDGCATAIAATDRGPLGDAFTACLASRLRDVRLECMATRGCARVMWSTVR